MPTKPKARSPKPTLKVTDDFLPEGYELPKGDSYFLKLQEGDNRVRILTKAVIGWQGWKDGVCKRSMGFENPFSVDDVDFDEKYKKPKFAHFWAFIVWNANDKKIQIWEVTQRGVLSGLYNLLQQEEWGDPRAYGIIVTKTVAGKKTDYKVNGVPPKPLTDDIKQALKDSNITIDRLFEDADDDEPVTVTKAVAGAEDF